MQHSDIDEQLIKPSGGWDVTKRHISRLMDEIMEHFVPYWRAHLPKCDKDSDLVRDIFGCDFVQSEPEISVFYPAVHIGGHSFTKHLDGYAHAEALVRENKAFQFEQRFLLVMPKNLLTGRDGFTLALRVYGNRNLTGMAATRQMLSAGIAAPRPEWEICISGMKLIGVVAASQGDREAQARVREFLMLLKIAVS